MSQCDLQADCKRGPPGLPAGAGIQMTTLTHTESTPRFLHLRAYLAGAGATGALIAGAAIVLLSVATFLGFNGLPFGGSGGQSGNAYLQSGAGAPAATAAALSAAPGAVAARPVGGAAA